MSPRNLPIFCFADEWKRPLAPMYTIAGKITITHTASYIPLSQSLLSPPILGIYSNTARSKLHQRKACLIFVGRVTRLSSNPAKNGKMVLVIPIRRCSAFSVQPPLRSPLGLAMARCASANAASETNTASVLFENLRTQNA